MLRQLAVLALSVLALLGAAVAPALGQDAKTLRVYFVGNSVTDTINYRALAELAKSRGHRHTWGRHMIPGAPLQWIWEHPNDGFQEPPFGHYPNALPNHPWDVLCLQPFDRHIEGEQGDLAMAKNFIDLALPNSPDLQVYVYARWPRQGKDDFDTAWQKKYTGGWDGTNETRDYFERLTLELRKTCPKLKKPVLIVPVGHVMHELNRQMNAGEVPGFGHIKEVYTDGIHLNHVGSYIVGCTFFATLYKENPKGLPSAPYKVDDAKLADIIQATAWKVVSTHELAGVAEPRANMAPAFDVVAGKAEDRIVASVEPDGVLFDVSSPSGIGMATIHRKEAQWPQTVVLRLRLKGLESLTLSSSAATLGVSVSSHGDQEGRAYLKDGGDERPIDKNSPYWTPVKLVGGRKVPLDDGYFELTLPRALLKDDPQALTIHWIDFYR